MPTQTQTETSIKNLRTESSTLEPSALLILFEIDLSTISTDRGFFFSEDQKVFRFHNSLKLTNNNIFWKGKEYIAAPIEAEGFEISINGPVPRPKLRLSVSDEGISAMSLFRASLNSLGDIIGAKVTRLRTFAAYIDSENFPEGLPAGFTPDPNAEETKDVFFIERKSVESKNIIEYQLSSLLDLEGTQLPRRLIFNNRCVAHYRGEGCLYEYNARKTDRHGDATLPNGAPPIATDRNELIQDILGSGTKIKTPTLYDPDKVYSKGDSVYITKDQLNYYFVAKIDNPTAAPPNLQQWIADRCSKEITGCSLRWGTNGSVDVGRSGGLVKGQLPFVGFPGVAKSR